MNFHGGYVHNFEEKLIDFSSNINPLGVPESFKLALLNQIDEFTKYPDIQYKGLRKAIAEYLGVADIEKIVPGNGAVEILYRAVQQSGKKRLIGLKPTFSEYAKAAFHGGIEYIGIDAFDKEYQEIDISKILMKANEDSAVIICNPNNPTGTLVKKSQLILLAKELQARNSMLVLDEAFMEFTADYPAQSMLDCIDQFDNLIIVKAATKFFGMPGIRLGYGISGNTHLLTQIRESMEPWNVNTAAVIAGSAVLKDTDYIEKSRVWAKSERAFMYEGLKRISGLRIYPSAANFHLVELLQQEFEAWTLKEKLLEKKFLIRTPEGFEGLNGQFVRLAVKDRQDNLALLKAFQEVFCT